MENTFQKQNIYSMKLFILILHLCTMIHTGIAQSITYRGFISATNSDMVESLPNESENPRGRSDVAAPCVTPLGHSLVVND